MNKIDKPFLGPKQQLVHLMLKGTKFELMPLYEAEDYLLHNNNYFKLRAYRKNFEKYVGGANDGMYINMDFAMLKDLAIIDMHLRYAFIQMTLDIEHFSKVKLLSRLQSCGEDGYAVVEDYFSKLKSNDLANDTHHYDMLCGELARNKNNPYCGGIIKKSSDGYSVWAFIEVVPLGSYINFFNFCSERLSDSELKDDFHLLMDIKELRNAAAHNNCIINDLGAKDRRHRTNNNVNQALGAISRRTRIKHFENERMRQICTLLYTHKRMVPSVGSHEHTWEMLDGICERMCRNAPWYKGNTLIESRYIFFKKAVDILR